MRVVIIGGNAAGMSAASRLKRYGKDVDVVVYEKTSEVSYGACGLPYYIGGENDDIDLLRIRKAEQFSQAGIEVNLEHKAVAVNEKRKIVTLQNCTDGSITEDIYDKLIIASGANPIFPKLPGSDLNGIFVLKSIEDAEQIKKRLLDSKTENVVIIGGGYIGLELAEACANQRKNSIRIIEAKSKLLPSFDDEFSAAARNHIEEHGIKVNTGEKAIKFEGSGDVTHVVTNRGTHRADIVLVAIGVRPNTEFIAPGQLDMERNGAIITNSKMQTSAADIYAAGDCSTVIHKLLLKPVYIPLATNANKQGRMTADCVIGKPVVYPGTLGTSIIRCLNLELAKTGLTVEQARMEKIDAGSVTVTAKTHAQYYPGSRPITIKLCYRTENKELLGAQIMGEKEAAWRINVFACAIHNGMTAAELGYLDLAYSPPYSTVWDAINISANVIK
jgi:NADPH-dependent 2,4-dienoyl-CoA reductase/sulfur reductase-like enzyme